MSNIVNLVCNADQKIKKIIEKLYFYIKIEKDKNKKLEEDNEK